MPTSRSGLQKGPRTNTKLKQELAKRTKMRKTKYMYAVSYQLNGHSLILPDECGHSLSVCPYETALSQ